MAITGTLSFGNVTLKVTPEELDKKADEVSKKIASMKTKFNDMNSKVKQSKSYWIGDAGDLHREIYQERQPEIEEIFKRLQEHVTELHQMSKVYTQAEKEAKAIAETLPTDVID